MVETYRPYQRLPGTGYRQLVPGWAILLLFFVIGIFALLLRGRRVQLWQGEDHLLLVEWDGYREYYKRFGYHDIQGFVIRKTSEGTALNIILAVAFIFLIAMTGVATVVAARVALLILAGIVAIILTANAASGPTCRCSLRTAVQTEDLPPLTRLRRARRVLERIRPSIIASQGQLAPEASSLGMPEPMARPAESDAASPGNAAHPVSQGEHASPPSAS
jgi:hypothetical protein